MSGSLRLTSLRLFQFKSYLSRSLPFTDRITGFSGPNGIGKTNLLEAIYYLCLTKGYFSRSDAGNVTFGYQGFRLEGVFAKAADIAHTALIFRETGKKELKVNNEPYPRFSDHIGRFPVVMVAPDDVELVTGGSEERRKMLDTIVSQLDSCYLQNLIKYNKVLLQRNSLLKQLAESRSRNESLLDILDDQLVDYGTNIFIRRKAFLDSFIPNVVKGYERLAGSTEGLRLDYSSHLNTHTFSDLLYMHRDRDHMAMRTTAGIHKDDIQIWLYDQPLRQVASQGQRKSLLFALKLAEFDALKEYNGFAPILLLDDVFEKLDESRMENLLHWACIENKGQIFLTDTHTTRLRSALEKLNEPFQLEELL